MNMNFRKGINWTSLLLGASLLTVPAAIATQQQDSSQQPAPDNTKTNQRDRDKNSPTADQQKMNPEDRELAKKIRSAIHDDKSLSMYAHNVKIIAQDGKVTLKGPVRTEDEKNAIEAKAKAVAGDGNVINQIDIAPKQ
jgi:hyperosmotically inducible periplasmic protein